MCAANAPFALFAVLASTHLCPAYVRVISDDDNATTDSNLFGKVHVKELSDMSRVRPSGGSARRDGNLPQETLVLSSGIPISKNRYNECVRDKYREDMDERSRVDA